MEQFVTDRSKWYDHIEGHLNEQGCDFSCSHPACCIEFENIEDLRHHLVDVHCYQPPRGRKRTWNEAVASIHCSPDGSKIALTTWHISSQYYPPCLVPCSLRLGICEMCHCIDVEANSVLGLRVWPRHYSM